MIILYICLAVIAFILLAYVFVFIRPRAKKPESKRLLCDYAHRGLHGHGVPENSLAAFELACREGCGIELDVQLTRDGTVMVFHDYTLTRMTGVDKRLCDLDADGADKLRLDGTDEKVPRFSEVLSLVDGRVPLLVELKGEDLNSALCPKVAELLKEYGGDYCIESFNPMLIKTMKKYLPHAFYGQLYTNVCRDKKSANPLFVVLTAMPFNFLARPDFIAYNKKDRNSLPVKLATRFYRATRFVWTVKNESEAKTAKKLGEHTIFERE